MSQQERTVITAEQEEALRNPPKKILGLFPRRQKAGSVSSNKLSSGSSTPAARPSTEKAPLEEYDDDDLPPREEEAVKEAINAEAAAVAKIPKTAGFDFKAISEVLGKDIDVDTMPAPRPQPASTATVDALKKTSVAPLERSESAPPPLQAEPASASSTASWDTSSSTTSHTNGSNPSLPSFTNEWSTPAAFPPLRSAPPARPHPANLFAASKKEDSERWATENPW